MSLERKLRPFPPIQRLSSGGITLSLDEGDLTFIDRMDRVVTVHVGDAGEELLATIREMIRFSGGSVAKYGPGASGEIDDAEEFAQHPFLYAKRTY